jgi:hypothetical protein
MSIMPVPSIAVAASPMPGGSMDPLATTDPCALPMPSMPVTVPSMPVPSMPVASPAM